MYHLVNQKTVVVVPLITWVLLKSGLNVVLSFVGTVLDFYRVVLMGMGAYFTS